jgi:small subunit ribosomal protein S20
LTQKQTSSISPTTFGGLLAALLFCNGRFNAADQLTEKRGNMANTPSAKKAARKIEARTEVNKSRRSRVRTFLRKFEDAVASGDQAAASLAFKAVEPEVMRAASKGVFHKNTASRKVSRLSARLKSMSA